MLNVTKKTETNERIDVQIIIEEEIKELASQKKNQRHEVIEK